MGIAVHRSFLTYVASVVQVHLDDAGRVHIDRVDQALDAGTVVNPEMVRNQFEGAATMGTSIAFYGEITATNGAVDQSNFDDYQMARMNTAPRETHVHIVESEAPPGGVGEPGLPAVCAGVVQCDFCGDRQADSGIAFEQGGLGVEPWANTPSLWTDASSGRGTQELDRCQFYILPRWGAAVLRFYRIRLRSSACVIFCVVRFAGACAAQPVLPQIDLPHPYYYREMYLPQLTSGPSSVAWSPDSKRSGVLDGGFAVAAED